MSDDQYAPRHRADVPVDYIRLAPPMRHPGAPRVMTSAEVADLQAAIRDPDCIRRLAADGRTAGMVEVDNPFRTELRPRRGTER